VSRYLLRVARETDSAAIRADAFHLTTDVCTAASVFVALGLVYITGIRLFDPIVALIVAIVIIRVAVMLTMEAAGVLIDARLPEDEVRQLGEIVMRTPGVIGFHKLRARKSGPYRQIDFHLIVPSTISVLQAHKLAEDIEQAMRDRFPNTTVVSHVEPDLATETREPDTALRRSQRTRRPHRKRTPLKWHL
jgi:cation diffusion facilitator family transporter